MAWVDSMRLRRRADRVRSLGWLNLFLTLVVCIANVSDGLETLGAGFVWAALVMALTHGAAWVLDRHADRIVTR